MGAHARRRRLDVPRDDERVRERAGRVRRVNAVYSYATKDSSTVEDWVEAYAPIIVQPRLSNRTPSILMLDDLPFTIKSEELAGGSPFAVAFRVFGALDYSSGKSKLLRLTAYPDARTTRWVDFLSQFDGTPDTWSSATRTTGCSTASTRFGAIGRTTHR